MIRLEKTFGTIHDSIAAAIELSVEKNDDVFFYFNGDVSLIKNDYAKDVIIIANILNKK